LCLQFHAASPPKLQSGYTAERRRDLGCTERASPPTNLVHQQLGSKISIPGLSRPLSPLRPSISRSIKSVVVLSLPRESDDGSGVPTLSESAVDGPPTHRSSPPWPWLDVPQSASHSSMHVDSRDIKTPYSWWFCAVHPLARRRIRCEISRRTCTSFHPQKTDQLQARSTYSTFPGGST